MKRINLILVSLLISVMGVSAQNFRTGYFLDGYMYKYQLNPAFQGERGFIAFPVIGGVALGVESNLAAGTFLYPYDGKLLTFLHPKISDQKFMDQIATSNPVNLNLDMNIFALGFRVKNTYHTLEMSLKSMQSASLPGDVFKFMKTGGSDGNNLYDFSSLSFNGNVYSELAYGFSIKIKDFISVGLRAKLLMGVMSMYTDIPQFLLSLQQDKWTINAEGASVLMPSVFASALTTDNMTDEQMITQITNMLTQPSLGAAFDLGVSVDFLKYFTASASILDLGFISWKNMDRLSLKSGYWEYTGMDNLSGGQNSDFQSQIDAKLEELESLLDFERTQSLDNSVQTLGFTTMLGLEFRMPFYQRLTVGALATHRFEGSSSWTEGRFSLNLAPLRWFSLTANYAISTFGQSYGAAMNIHPKGFNLFLGLDSFKPLLNVTPEFIPIDELNTNLKFGVTFPFGKYNGRYPKATAAKDTKQTKSKKESVKKESSKKN